MITALCRCLPFTRKPPSRNEVERPSGSEGSNTHFPQARKDIWTEAAQAMIDAQSPVRDHPQMSQAELNLAAKNLIGSMVSNMPERFSKR